MSALNIFGSCRLSSYTFEFNEGCLRLDKAPGYVQLGRSPLQVSYAPLASRKHSVRRLSYCLCSKDEKEGSAIHKPHKAIQVCDVLQSQRDLESLRVSQLRDLLRERGLKVSGVKHELVERLRDAGFSADNCSSLAQESGHNDSGPEELETDKIAELMFRAGVSVPQPYLEKRANSSRDSIREGKKTSKKLSDTPPANLENSDPANNDSQRGQPPSADRSEENRHSVSRRNGRQRATSTKSGRKEERSGRLGKHERMAVTRQTVNGTILVEGEFDRRAVKRAVDATGVFSVTKLAKTYGTGKQFRAKIAELIDGAEKVYVLMDPDNAGQDLRAIINSVAGTALNAFIPVAKCSADEDTKHHSAGNVGVEHASPADIQAALLAARPAALGRGEFAMAELVEWGLASAFGAAPAADWSAHGGVRARRRLLSEALGLHDGSAKSLLNNLNRFFSREEVESALKGLPGPGESIPEKKTDGIADLGPPKIAAKGFPSSFPSYPMKK